MAAILSFLRSDEVLYVILIFIVFIVPKMLQRFRLPAAITSFALGLVAGLGFNMFANDATIGLLATLGIVTLFLHAGLDVSIPDLRRHRKVLVQHVILFVVLMAATAYGVYTLWELPLRLSVLLALALVTPSTGFIIDSLKSWELAEAEREWIRMKAVATELVALLCMFFALQSVTLESFLISMAVVLALTLLIPLLFRFFASWVAPYAPNSDFAFLIMLAIVCAFITRKIGAYYLVGAFVVGIAARRFEQKVPSLTSERLIGSVELFASFFVPFYFFHSGTLILKEDLSGGALLVAMLAAVVLIPARTLVVAAHRRLVLKESIRRGLRIATPMIPTLIFTLVLAQLMREQFGLNGEVYGGLVIYAILNSILVSLIFKSPEPDFTAEVLEEGLSRFKPAPQTRPE